MEIPYHFDRTPYSTLERCRDLSRLKASLVFSSMQPRCWQRTLSSIAAQVSDEAPPESHSWSANLDWSLTKMFVQNNSTAWICSKTNTHIHTKGTILLLLPANSVAFVASTQVVGSVSMLFRDFPIDELGRPWLPRPNMSGKKQAFFDMGETKNWIIRKVELINLI